MQGCVLAAGTEIHSWVCQLQGAQIQLRVKVTKLFCWESIWHIFSSTNLSAVILNEELGALAQGLLGTSTQSGVQSQGNISESLAAFLIWSGIWGSGWLQNPPGLLRRRQMEAKGRAQGSLLLQPSLPGFYLREAKASQKLPCCIQDSPAPRRQRVTQQRSLEPMAASGA